MRFYAVEAKCGHVGKFNCVWVRFAVKADSGKEAASKVRNFSRVKRHHKDFIRSLKEVSYEEYRLLLLENRYDPYLHCKNVQQQNGIAFFSDRIKTDEYNVSRLNRKKSRNVEYCLKRFKMLVENANRQIIDCLV